MSRLSPRARRWTRRAALALLIAACDDPVTPNTAPEVALVTPTTGALFAGGDTLRILVAANDPQEGSLPASALEWWVVLHHDTHTHPVRGVTPGGEGAVPVPRVGHTDAGVFYRVYAVATDRGGLADTTFVDVHPRLVTLRLQTQPAGLTVTLDHQPQASPVVVQAIVGTQRDVGVVSPQDASGSAWELASWSDAGAATHTVTVPATDLVLTATFSEVGAANLAPTVSVTQPAPGAVVTAGAPVFVTATAADADGSVAKVEFFAGATKLGEDTDVPYSVSWTPTGTGPRTLTARATDDRGAITNSSGVTVTVQAAGGGDGLAPTATLTAPTAGTTGLTGAVQLTATASDNVGVTLVEFELDGQPLAADATAPYEATLASTAAYTSGAHVFRARARDAAGNWSPWSESVVTFGGDVALPQGFVRQVLASGFGDVLTAIAVAPDGRIFAAQQNGSLRIVKNGVLLAQPFAQFPVTAGGERGLLGVTFHPQFASNGFVYVYYTASDGGDAAHNRIVRVVADGDVMRAGSEMAIADLPPASGSGKHNGGAMHFGVDGKLYVATGDNTEAATAQSLDHPFGKILRFNADGSIPGDNPFLAQTTGINRAIWARGLRNPFTFAIEPGTGRMHVNDVGASTWEEVNLGRAGANFGWPLTEGPTSDPAYDAPILAYRHSDSPTLFSGYAVVGAAFYHPPTPMFGAAYVGSYFFADYVMGWVYRLDPANGNAAYAFAQLGGFVTDLAIGNDGSLYVARGLQIERISR